MIFTGIVRNRYSHDIALVLSFYLNAIQKQNISKPQTMNIKAVKQHVIVV